ncbi:30S ribosomal protein S17 [candidate division WOR-1 bacterium RIFOXYC2_FULL_37_10]|uniref:Small ribosomal subunit protein uS17 n=1 Tax=candidate division WOR-1 bacterium RIFOXYB2_FULL_37_13 TaxID=1802579 RepID=A0A1F4SRW8_UNCSA|nr:MAG: 30S ribosomal protein S17 [candidate division WOR-1 bacterium RIFOXYA2_FULL_37_7]OGC23184.1 MAG: 30S ribosomal protein S17 [candidate division WOR-1 bacterium RIFOXYB2_FULL_37_13]OGC33548.1 MAG: 30S ribosomal protein S17 [candidate division WOR-1 bacterium RIFOXYC2_FULL_37_10]
MERNRRRVKKGIVVGSKMNKTVVVQIETVFSHPKYSKVVRVYKKFLVHDEKGESKIGDLVQIMETRPISKRKFHRIVKVLGQAKLKYRDLPKKKEKEEEEKDDTSRK